MVKQNSRYVERQLQGAWSCAQIGFFIFPWFPALGAVGIAIALLSTLWYSYPQIIRRPLNWGMGILSLWLVITSCFAFKPSEAFLGLANFLPFFVFFAAFSTLIQTPKQLRRLAWILVIPSLLVAILGFGQLFLGWAQPDHFPAILGWELAPNGNPRGRMASVFIYANILAAYLQIVFILGLGLWIETFQAWRQHRHKFQTHLQSNTLHFNSPLTPSPHPPPTNQLLFLTLTVLGDAIALVLTNSRNAWGIAILACLAFALYQGWRWLVGMVIAAATVILAAAFSPPPLAQWLRKIVPAYFWARLTDQLYPDRPVALLRVTQWRFAWSLTQQRPWVGWGLRNFTPLYEQKMNLWLGHPHNLLLMLTAEMGIPATILLFSLVGWILAQGILLLNRWQPGQDRLMFFSYLVAFGGCSLFNSVDITLFDLRVNTLGWLLLSAICGVVTDQNIDRGIRDMMSG